MDSMPDVTASQPKICDFTKREYFEYAGASGGYIDKYGYPFCRGRILSNCERDNAQYDETREVFWASGACMVIRAAAYHEAEGFDESLFAHMEEIDLCWRLKNQGHLIYCFPEVKVFHLGGGTLSAKRPKKTFLNFRNSLIVALKNDHRERLFQRLLKRLLLDGLGAFYLLITSGPSHFFAVVRAHFAFYMVFGKVRRTRRILKAKAHNRNHTGFYKRSIVLDYFLQGKKEFETLRSADFIL